MKVLKGIAGKHSLPEEAHSTLFISNSSLTVRYIGRTSNFYKQR